MVGFIYRLGVSIKELGERAGHKRRWYAGLVIRLGLAIKDSVQNCPVGAFVTKKHTIKERGSCLQ